MNLGQNISNIRRQKNIPVNYLIRNCISRSGYTRFIEGHRNISVNKFIKIVERLNITWPEFNYITHHHRNLNKEVSREIQNAITENNADYLNKIQTQLKSLFQRNHKYNKYFYLYCLTKLITEKIKHQKLNKVYKKAIKKYLLSRYTWTYFELSLFNYSLFICNPKTIWFFTTRVLIDLKKYQNFSNNENECARLLVNLTILYLFKKDTHHSKILIHHLNHIQLGPNMILERLLIKYLNGISMIISKNKKGYKLVQDSFTGFKVSNSKPYYLSYKTYFHKITKIYKIRNN